MEKSALDKHMRFRHTNERPFMCDTCGFSTHTASAMARHKRSHSNTKPHQCDICGNKYADKKRLRDHMYTHTDHKPFQCQLCSYSCKRKDNLATHIKKNHDDTKMEKLEKMEVFPNSILAGSNSNSITVSHNSTWTNHVSLEVEPPKPTWQSGQTTNHMVAVTCQPLVVAKKSAPLVATSTHHVSTIALNDIVLSNPCEDVTYTVPVDGEEVILVSQNSSDS